jgi:hypothetical protein
MPLHPFFSIFLFSRSPGATWAQACPAGWTGGVGTPPAGPPKAKNQGINITPIERNTEMKHQKIDEDRHAIALAIHLHRSEYKACAAEVATQATDRNAAATGGLQ